MSHLKKLDDQIFRLKFSAKTLNRQSIRCEKDEKKEKAKLVKAIEKGNTEGAKIYAQNAIRKKNEALNFLRIASRCDAVASRLQSAAQMQRVTKMMGSIVREMGEALDTMNLEKISKTMDLFERQFEEVDMRSEFVEDAMNQSTSMTTPQDQVDDLIQQVAEQNGLKLADELGSQHVADGALQLDVAEDEKLSQRLAVLRQKS